MSWNYSKLDKVTWFRRVVFGFGAYPIGPFIFIVAIISGSIGFGRRNLNRGNCQKFINFIMEIITYSLVTQTGSHWSNDHRSLNVEVKSKTMESFHQLSKPEVELQLHQQIQFPLKRNLLAVPLGRLNRFDLYDQIDLQMPWHEKLKKYQTISMSYCSWPVRNKCSVWKCYVQSEKCYLVHANLRFA